MEFYLKELFEPENLMRSSGNEGILPALKNYLIVPLVVSILLGLLSGLAMMLFTGDIVSGIIAIIAAPIGLAITGSIMVLIINLTIFIGAKLVGSQTSFSEQTYKLSLIALPIIIIQTGLLILAGVGIATSFILIGIPILLVAYAIIYAFLLFVYHAVWVSVREIHSFDNIQLMKAMVVSIVVVAIILGVIGAILGVLVFGAILSAMTAMGPTGFFGLM